MNHMLTAVLLILLTVVPTSIYASEEEKAAFIKLKDTVTSRSNKRQLDAETLEMARQLIQTAEQIYGPGSQEVASAYYNQGYIYKQRKEFPQAESAFAQAILIIEKLTYPGEPWISFYILNLAAAYEGQKAWGKAALQFERAIALIEKDKGAESESLVNPLMDLANSYHLNREHVKAANSLLRSADIAEKLNSRYSLENITHSLDILGNHFLRNGNAVQASSLFERELGILQKLDAKADVIKAASLSLDKSRQLSGQGKPSAVAASKKREPKATEKAQQNSSALAANTNSSGISTRSKSPSNYEYIKPAKMYITEAGHWVVGTSRADAENIILNVDLRGTQTWRHNWSSCLQQADRCPWKPLQELGHGWFAVIKAHAYQSNTHGVNQMIFYGYESPTRQEAINKALSDYKNKRGDFIIQEMHIGLISEIDWSDVKRNYDTTGWIEERDEINYHEICDWTMYGKPYGGRPGSHHDEYGRNVNPLIFTGIADNNPNCVTVYRPSEKLPPPKLVLVPK